MNEPHFIVFFDGVCNLCSGTVQFIIRRDPQKKFRFSSLQSSYAEKTLPQLNQNLAPLSSILLLTGGHIDEESTAFLKITRELTGLWPLLYAFIIIPKPIRDFFYKWVARNRYRWFGKKEVCWIPTAELKDRFIE